MFERERTLLELMRVPGRVEEPPLPRPSDSEWRDLADATSGPLRPWLSYSIELAFPQVAPPPAVATALLQARRSATIGYLRRQALLRRLLPVLEAAGIPAVVLKGCALAHLAYPDPSLRTMDDLDLWVRPSDLDRAVTAAGAAGLAYSTRYRDRTAADKDQQSAITRVLEEAGSGLVVELHGELHSLAGFSPAWLERAWNRREERMLGGTKGWVMHPEDMLTHLAIHCGRHHQFDSGLRPLLDITLWLESDGHRIGWPGLLREWERERVTTWALLPVSLAKDLLGAPVPADVADRIGRFPGSAELRDVARQLVLGALLRLPPTMALLASSTPGEGIAWMSRRLTTWYWRGPPGSRRTSAQVLQDGLRRMWHDLRHKAGPYLHAIWDGHFWGADFRRRRQVALGRRRLAALVEAHEAGSGPRSGKAL